MSRRLPLLLLLVIAGCLRTCGIDRAEIAAEMERSLREDLIDL